MKTDLLFSSKLVAKFLAMRFAFLIGIIVFAVSMGKSQTNTTTSTTDQQTMKSGAESVKYTGITQTNNTVIPKNNTNDTPQKEAGHASDINNSDYATKKAEWIKNYPQVYEQLSKP